MSSGFTANEMVTVSLSPGVRNRSGGPVPPYQYQFMISGHWTDTAPQNAKASMVAAVPVVTSSAIPSPMLQTLNASPGVAGIMSNGVSVPSDFPWIVITTNNNPDPDPILLITVAAGEIPSTSSLTTVAIQFGMDINCSHICSLSTLWR